MTVSRGVSVALLWLAALAGSSALAAPPPSGAAADYLEALVRFEPWAETVWRDFPAIPGAGYFGDGAADGNGGIRGSCGVALGYAVLVREFPGAPQRQRRLQRVEAALRYAVSTHSSGADEAVTVDGKKWGVFPGMRKFDAHGWQSPLWAGTMGFAAAILEKELHPAVVAACRRVVAAEADVLVDIPPATGYRRNTRCEENAWDSNVVALAAAWMPDDPRAKQWLPTAKRYLANTYTVPDFADDPLRDWVTTQTLFPSYGLENHGFYHPSYQIDGANSLGDSYLMARLTNPRVAEELRPFAEHNVRPVWDFLKTILLDTGEVAYPSGLDWSLHSFEHCSYLAYLATHFAAPEAQWAQPRLARQILARQAASGDGRFVGDSCPNGFYREAVEARHTAIAYLHNQLAGFPADAGAPPKEQLAHYADIGLIFQRTEKMLVTISYGARTMALVYPLGGKTPGEQFIVSPNTSSLIGPAGKTTLVEFQPTAAGFRAKLQLAGKGGRRSTMTIAGVPGAVALVEIPPAGTELPDEWYLMGIENHSFCGGARTAFWPDHQQRFVERSGRSAAVAANWINVDDWLGFVTAPGGELRYEAASTFNRDGAAEDGIVFRPSDRTAARAVLVLPGATAGVTETVFHSLHWSTADETWSLTLTRPDGEPFELRSAD